MDIVEKYTDRLLAGDGEWGPEERAELEGSLRPHEKEFATPEGVAELLDKFHSWSSHRSEGYPQRKEAADAVVAKAREESDPLKTVLLFNRAAHILWHGIPGEVYVHPTPAAESVSGPRAELLELANKLAARAEGDEKAMELIREARVERDLYKASMALNRATLLVLNDGN